MYLKSVELIGFKSFAKKTELSFATPITAIVGPNGSGKSNTAEAFRFVLGEQSIKSMRGKRTEDLIWNGSGELGRSNRASVKVVFDNRARTPSPISPPPDSFQGSSPLEKGERGEADGRLLNLDVDEVTIERIIFRDASSEYMLNGSPVRLRDIIELLASAHIGSSGHHIISQGEADRVLNANMRERREMIEDALGLKIYQWKREESEKKLEKTDENMKQVQSLRREIAPHLSFLKKQVEKVEKTKQLKDELKTLYGEYLKREHAYITITKRSLALEEQAPRRELAELEKKLTASRQMLEETHGKDAKTREVIAMEQKLGDLRRERELLSREVGLLEGEIAGARRLLQVQGAAEAGTVVIPLSDVEGLVRQIESVSAEEDEKDVGVLLATVNRIKEVMRAFLELHKKRKPKGSEEVENELAALTLKKTELEQKLMHIAASEGETVRNEKKLRLDIEKDRDSNRDAEKEMFRIMARQQELRAALNTLAARLAETEHLEGDFKRELTEGVLLVGRELLDYERVELKNPQGIVLSPEELALENRAMQEERRRKVEKLKIRIEDAGGGSGAEVLKEFQEVTERDQFLGKELADLEKSAETLRQIIADLEQKLDEEFRGGIQKINAEFQKFFELMFGGGTARLAIAKPEKKARRIMDDLVSDVNELPNPPEEEEDAPAGIDIEVSLPRKKTKGLMMLSGGERALTSIALLFAMSQVKPPPFIILDETDAALDEANSKKYGDMIENLSKYSQLILITHNRETMSRAGIIYGVTMDKTGVSKLLSIAFDEAVAVAK